MSFQKFQLKRILIYIRSSLWFVPSLLTLGALALATMLIELDLRFYDGIRERLPQLLITEPEGAHSMLSAIGTSMATVAGVVFSITIVALTLTSTQFSPRVLRNFMRDRSNQIVLGVFVGVYIYCLIVLKTISGGDTPFVPSLAVLAGLLSAIVAMGFFIFFIHHISTAIQASEIAAAITRETLIAIERVFPEHGKFPHPCRSQLTEPPPTTEWRAISSTEMGYIQTVDEDALFAFACKYQTIVRMEYGIGDFVGPGRPLISIVSKHPIDDTLVKHTNKLFAIGSYRTIEQDISFGIRQLVDISLKALSPSVNDTTTAVTCIEHLTVILARSSQRCVPRPYRCENDELRVINQSILFEDLVSLTYRQILDHAYSNAELITQLFRSIERVIQSTTRPAYLVTLQKWAELIASTSRDHLSNPHARHRVEEHYRNVQLALAHHQINHEGRI